MSNPKPNPKFGEVVGGLVLLSVPVLMLLGGAYFYESFEPKKMGDQGYCVNMKVISIGGCDSGGYCGVVLKGG